MDFFCPHCGFETDELIDCQSCSRTGCERCIGKSRLGHFCSNCRINKLNTTGPESALRSQI